MMRATSSRARSSCSVPTAPSASSARSVGKIASPEESSVRYLERRPATTPPLPRHTHYADRTVAPVLLSRPPFRTPETGGSTEALLRRSTIPAALLEVLVTGETNGGVHAVKAGRNQEMSAVS